MKQKRVRSFWVFIKAVTTAWMIAWKDFIHGTQKRINLFPILVTNVRNELEKCTDASKGHSVALNDAIEHVLHRYPQAGEDINNLRIRLRTRLLGEWTAKGNPASK